jgi:hypothetical protein
MFLKKNPFKMGRGKTKIWIGVIVLALTILFVPKFALAAGGIDNLLLSMVSWILFQIMYVLSQLLLLMIVILVKVAAINDFVGANVVKIGWVIIRDIANMAIVVAMLFIAFGTTINKQSYAWRTMLPKLIFAAILLNFSKTIAGLMIDLGQVVMMVFVNAFQDIAAGNLTYGLGLEDMVSASKNLQSAGVNIDDLTVMGAVALGVILLAVALGVILQFTLLLLMRVVNLWLMIVFSPLIYVGGLFPSAQKYVNKYWIDFGQNITFGPIIAFLFWLTMQVLSQITKQNRTINLDLRAEQYLAGGVGVADPANATYFASQISSPQRLFDYMVTIALLIASLMFAKKVSIQGGEMVGKAYNKISNAGKYVARRPLVWGRKAGGATLNTIGEKTGLKFVPGALKDKIIPKGWSKSEREAAAALKEGQVRVKVGGYRNKMALVKAQSKTESERARVMRDTKMLKIPIEKMIEKIKDPETLMTDARIYMKEIANAKGAQESDLNKAITEYKKRAETDPYEKLTQKIYTGGAERNFEARMDEKKARAEQVREAEEIRRELRRSRGQQGQGGSSQSIQSGQSATESEAEQTVETAPESEQVPSQQAPQEEQQVQPQETESQETQEQQPQSIRQRTSRPEVYDPEMEAINRRAAENE